MHKVNPGNIITIDELNANLRGSIVSAESLSRVLDSHEDAQGQGVGSWLKTPDIEPQALMDVIPYNGILYYFNKATFCGYLDAFLQKHSYSWVYAFNLGNTFHTSKSGGNGYLQYPPDMKFKYENPQQFIELVHKYKLDDSKRCNIGSVSKTISAVAMIRILGETSNPKVTLDDKIGPWIPSSYHDDIPFNNWPTSFNDVTFRMLLNHTSGLTKEDDELPPGATWQSIVQNHKAQALPAPFEYSNAGYAVLRNLVLMLFGQESAFDMGNASATDKHGASLFVNYIRNSILGPSGIVDAIWGPSNKLPVTPLAYPFPHKAGTPGLGHKPYENLENNVGPGSLYLSARELLKFLAALYGGKLLSPAQFKEMHDLKYSDPDDPYGLGVHFYTLLRQQASANLKQMPFFPVHYSHGGDQNWNSPYWQRTRWACVSELGFQVVVMSNCCDGLDGPNKASQTTELRELLSDWFNLSIAKIIVPQW